jgi:alpha-tubulin suppressor-like RCC1 family protein
MDPIEVPLRMAPGIFNSTPHGKQIKKIASGGNHTLLLSTDGTVFGLGDPESGKIGRMLKTRHRD